jgi:hypothetical protein
VTGGNILKRRFLFSLSFGYRGFSLLDGAWGCGGYAVVVVCVNTTTLIRRLPRIWVRDTHDEADALRRIHAAAGGWYRRTARVTFSLKVCAKLSLVHSSEKQKNAVASNAQGLRKKATTT